MYLRTSTSDFGETIASLTASALDRSEKLGDALLNVTLDNSFDGDKIGQQLEQVSSIP